MMRRFDLKALWTMILAGALATVAFDGLGQSISPLLGFPTLVTVTLPNSVIQALTGSAYMPAAYLLHLMTGLLAFPAGWMFVAQPIAQRLAPAVPRMLVAVVYGALLWVFALYVMAHLVVGLPAFLGFSSVAWVALVAHVLFACVVAAVVHWRDND